MVVPAGDGCRIRLVIRNGAAGPGMGSSSGVRFAGRALGTTMHSCLGRTMSGGLVSGSRLRGFSTNALAGNSLGKLRVVVTRHDTW